MKKITSIVLILIMTLCFFTSALATSKWESVIADTASYIYETVSNPEVGSIGGEWAILGLARGNTDATDEYFAKYYDNIEKYVKEHGGNLHDKKYTEYSRVILALTSIGKNPADVGGYNLLTPLGDYEKTIAQGVNGAIWALIALDSVPYDMPQNSDAETQATREMYVDYILKSQKEDGGWALLKSTPQSDIDITAMAIYSLSEYSHRDDVNFAIEKALLMLSKRQNSSGGFDGGETAESSAQVICALCSLGIKIDDSRFVKNGKTALDSLLSYRKDGGFKHIQDGGVNQMATEQAFYSLVALCRMENNLPPIMKMTDVEITLEDSVKEEIAPDIIEINFSDIIGHKNEYAIKKLAQKGIINGKGEGIFDPENTMTRAEFATIIVKALGVEIKNISAFTDVNETDWFYGYVGTAYDCGIINGVGEGEFNPYGTISRQEASAMLSRAAGLIGLTENMDIMGARDVLSMYIDYIKASDWAIKPLAFCISEGIINEEGLEILPKKEVTRAEIEQMVYNLLERVGRL